MHGHRTDSADWSDPSGQFNCHVAFLPYYGKNLLKMCYHLRIPPLISGG